jgi:hypothetical protein
VLRRLAPDKHLHLFDTWAGTPYDDELCHHKRGEWKADFEECQTLIGKGELTHYYRGTFPHDFRGTIDGLVFCFAFVDMDTYQSTRDAVEFFWPRLVTGGRLVFDDYGWLPCAGVKKALDDCLPPFIGSRVVQSQYLCIVEKR